MNTLPFAVSSKPRDPLQLRSGIVDTEQALDAVRTLLLAIGEDPSRPGLRETPYRVVKALLEATAGQGADAKDILSRVFPEETTDMVVVKGIEFRSTCEHHLLPFTGIAAIAYIPGPHGVVGLSKLPRLVIAHAQRLQVQERMTANIADDIVTHLAAKGVGVVIAAKHSCMCGRGVNQPHASAITCALRGELKDRPEARAEMLAHLGPV